MLAAGGCGGDAEHAPTDDALPTASVEEAFEACLAGDTDAGIATLDALILQSPNAAEALVSRGLCHWTQWDETGDEGDVQQAYLDLTAAIEVVEENRDGAQATSLDRMYSQRAFIARALDDGWVRTLEDLDRAVDLAPQNPAHALDRGVVRSYVGDTSAARADLRRFLVLADSEDVERRAVVEGLLETLGPANQ